nr:hypothetical protein [Tanacetum cinerariifolium]
MNGGNEEIGGIAVRPKRLYVDVIRLQTSGNTSNNFKTGNTCLVGFDSLGYAFGPLTQGEVAATTAEQVIASALKGKAVDIQEIPSFSLGLTQDFDEFNRVGRTRVSTNMIQPINAMPFSVCPPSSGKNVARTRKGKMQHKVTSHMKSPFLSRVVNIDGVLSGEEYKVTKLLFHMTGDP